MVEPRKRIPNRMRAISDLLRSAVLGFTGGFISTGAMTAFRMPISRSLPPTENFWIEYMGDELEEYRLPAMILHLFYGAIAGSVFGAVFPLLDERSPFGTETTGLLGGIAYSIPFTAFGEFVMVDRLMELDLDSNESMIFHASHLVYGVTLGAWVGSRYDTISDDSSSGS